MDVCFPQRLHIPLTSSLELPAWIAWIPKHISQHWIFIPSRGLWLCDQLSCLMLAPVTETMSREMSVALQGGLKSSMPAALSDLQRQSWYENPESWLGWEQGHCQAIGRSGELFSYPELEEQSLYCFSVHWVACKSLQCSNSHFAYPGRTLFQPESGLSQKQISHSKEILSHPCDTRLYTALVSREREVACLHNITLDGQSFAGKKDHNMRFVFGLAPKDWLKSFARNLGLEPRIVAKL